MAERVTFSAFMFYAQLIITRCTRKTACFQCFQVILIFLIFYHNIWKLVQRGQNVDFVHAVTFSYAVMLIPDQPSNSSLQQFHQQSDHVLSARFLYLPQCRIRRFRQSCFRCIPVLPARSSLLFLCCLF